MTDRIYCITFYIWDPETQEYDQEKSENFEHALPPVPLIGEEVLINISEPGILVEYRPYTVVRRSFEYTTGSVVLHNMPRQTPIEAVGVSLYVRERVTPLPRDGA